MSSCPILDEKIANEIIETVSTSTVGMKRLCKANEHWPSHETVNQWRLHYPLFADRYACAKRIQADLLAEEALEISDDSSQDTIIDPETGHPRCDHEWVHRSRLRIDTRKWLAAKLLPRAYGDRQHVEQTVTVTHEDTLKELA